jgi:hypothetical protein
LGDKKGGCWRIGNGENIRVWEDNWLPFQNGFKLLAQQPLVSNVSRVKDLFVEGSYVWNETLIDNSFNAFEANHIKQIPLINQHKEDQLMWMSTNNGLYTVSSGYQAIKEWERQKEPSSSMPQGQNKVWKKIWELNIPPRCQVFLWRILNNIVPVRFELAKRGVNCTILCPMCFSQCETLDHTFMHCYRAKKVWFGAEIGINFSDNSQIHFYDWIGYMLNHANTIILLLWKILIFYLMLFGLVGIRWCLRTSTYLKRRLFNTPRSV